MAITLDGTTGITASGNVTGGNIITAGAITATGNITGGNVNITGSINPTSLTATGNVTGGNLTTAGTANIGTLAVTGISTHTGNAAFGNISTTGLASIGSTLSVTGNANVGNLGTVALVATGTGSFAGNVAMNSKNITGLADPVNAQDAATKNYVDTTAQGLHVHDSCIYATTGTLATASGGTTSYNNGSSGVGATITTTGTYLLIDGGNVQTAGLRILVKNEANAAWNGVYTYTNTTTVTRATDFDTAADMQGGDFLFVTSGSTQADTSWVQTTDNPTPGVSNIVFSQFSGQGTYTAGTGLTLTGTTFSVNASQTQVTSVGTLGSLSVTGNISGGNISTAGNLAASTAAQNTNTTQVATTAFVLAQASSTTPTSIGTNTVGTGTTFARADHTHTGVSSLANGGGITASASTGAITLGSTATSANTVSAIVARDASGNFSAGTITATLSGAATTAGTVTTAAQGNITSVGTLSSLTVSGVIQPNANATIDLGATAARFNNVYGVTFIGVSNTAKYADLAENYVADAEYAPGTVVSFGGSEEVTLSNLDADTAVAGVVSENPAYLMNSHQEGTYITALALQGRVLCNVTGIVNKGDMLVSAGNGQARAEKSPGVGTVIGKALQHHAGGNGTIEVVVGIR